MAASSPLLAPPLSDELAAVLAARAAAMAAKAAMREPAVAPSAASQSSAAAPASASATTARLTLCVNLLQSSNCELSVTLLIMESQKSFSLPHVAFIISQLTTALAPFSSTVGKVTAEVAIRASILASVQQRLVRRITCASSPTIASALLYPCYH
jgi:hypothetical protein